MKKLIFLAIIFLFYFFNSYVPAQEILIGCSYNAKITDVDYNGDTIEYKSGIDYFKLDELNKGLSLKSCLLCKIGAKEFEQRHIKQYNYDSNTIFIDADVTDNGRPRTVTLKIDRITGEYNLIMSVKTWFLFTRTAPSTYYQSQGICKPISQNQKF